jgi:hypothetical protein
MTATTCACTGPGFCTRHQCVKTAHWHHLCQTRADYFQLWEEGRGPGQTLPPPSQPRTDCRHRGAAVREEVCPSCQGHVRLKVFACALHLECTLARPVVPLACCATCPDYAPGEATQDQTASPAISPTEIG